MNRTRSICNLIICLMIISLTGCSLPTAPSNLIRPPQANEANLKLKQDIEKFLPPEARLTIPASSKGNAKTFFEADINGDGVNEILAFYKLGNEGFRLGFIVLTPAANQGWQEMARVDEYADDIVLVDFIDITGNKVPDLLVGWSGGSYDLGNQLSIYSFNNNELISLEPISYRNLTTGDLDGDKLAELAIIIDKRVQDIPNAVVEVYKYENQELNLTYTAEFAGCYPGELLIGNAAPEKKGLFVETYLGAHSAATHLLVYQEGQLISALAEEPDDVSYNFKPYPLPSKDVDGDGIIEIGIHIEPPGSENLAMVEIPWIENWYRWDGQTGLEWVSEVYADYGLSYEWQIPAQWRDQYTITRETGEEISRVEFYALADKYQHEIFTLLTIDDELWEAEEKRIQQEGKIYEVIEENRLLGKVYVAILAGLETDQTILPITLEQIKARFRVVSS